MIVAGLLKTVPTETARDLIPPEAPVTTRHEIDIWWSDDDRAFVAEVPELPGCMAHGATRKHALAAAEDAIALWLEAAMKDGAPIPRPRSRPNASI